MLLNVRWEQIGSGQKQEDSDEAEGEEGADLAVIFMIYFGGGEMQ